MTGDAGFTQREICHTILDRGGYYSFVDKDNQPRLREDIALLFAAPPEAGAAPPRDARC